MKNALYFGDNLDVLRRYIPDESVDLVYLDPPSNSNADYNVLFAAKDGDESAAQIEAFTDTWRWDRAAAAAFDDVVFGHGADEHGAHLDLRTSRALQGFRSMIGECDLLAYLAFMAPRLLELRRVLAPTGSIYLHCDPTASHYLKVLMDAVFGPEHFRSEVIWQRTGSHNSAKRWAPVHDVLLFYSKGDSFTWNPIYQPLPQETIDAWYNNVEEGTGRRYNRADLTGAGTRTGPSGEPWRGVDPTAIGRHWAIPRFVGDLVDGLDTHAALDALDAAGRIHWPKKEGGKPMLKRYVEEARGIPALDVVTDIGPLKNSSAERLGYPTQKPEALLDRIISVKSGKVEARDVRDLRSVVDREDADIGVLLTLQEPSRPMRTEASSAGFYKSPTWNRNYPRLQILTVAELLDGREVQMPPVRHTNETYRQAPRSKGKVAEQGSLGL